MEISFIMDAETKGKISKEWGITLDTISRYTSFFDNKIKPLIRENYLSHLVTTVGNMVNDKRASKYFAELESEEIESSMADRAKIRSLIATRTFRLYSIIIEPANLKRRATTRHHPSGAIIYYNSCFDQKTIRILIAHEIGHIVNKELFEPKEDNEQTANLFAYIAIDDKDKFYTKECEQFVYTSDIQIINDILKNCPVKTTEVVP